MLALCGCVPVTKTSKSAGRLSQNFDNYMISDVVMTT